MPKKIKCGTNLADYREAARHARHDDLTWPPPVAEGSAGYTFMEMSAFFGQPEGELVYEECSEPVLDDAEFVAGQPVHVTAGPLSGLGGVTHHQAYDGRWIIELDGVAPGVFLCIDADKLAYG